MKIKTKLIISFCMILFVPILLAMVAAFGFQNIQMRAIAQTYNLEDNYQLTDSFTNSLHFLNSLTADDYDRLSDLSKTDPDQLTRESFWEEMQESLSEKGSYLVVYEDGQLVYNGGEDNEEQLKTLTESRIGVTTSDISGYLESGGDVLIKHVDFASSEGVLGNIYILTTTKSIVPEVRRMMMDMGLAILIILVMTAFLLILWIYNGMITPLHKLQEAAENIKEGNLDFQIDTDGYDEFSELAVTFEQMRARLKDNVEEKMEAEKENRALISNIAHDLKTPITSIKGYSEGILDGVANTPEKVEKYVRTIYNKANEMNNLINELTLYSKIDTNRIPYNFVKINVNDYFGDVMEEMGLDLEEKGMKLSYTTHLRPDTMIIADPEQLHRVISNIIGNSVKYMDKKDGFIDVRLYDEGDFIRAELEDNGRGIAQKDLPYIFDRFYRADASRNSGTGGSGIGLSIVKKIIEDHGGKIWANSKEDSGTTMIFVIRKYIQET